MVTPPEFVHLVGHRFPGGTLTVPHWLNHLWGDAVVADESRDHVHPLLVYYAAVDGVGTSFQEIFDLLEGSVESGIQFGEQRFSFSGPVEVGREYEVEGEITGVERKRGKRAGEFDIATFELRVREPGVSEPLATSTTSFVFPRGEAG